MCLARVGNMHGDTLSLYSISTFFVLRLNVNEAQRGFVHSYSKEGGHQLENRCVLWLLHSSNITITAFYFINLILLKVVATTFICQLVK